MDNSNAVEAEETSSALKIRVAELESRLASARRALLHYENACYLQESIIDHSDALIGVCDAGGRILLWNEAAEAISGYPREEALGSNQLFRRLFPDRKVRRQVFEMYGEVRGLGRTLENFEIEIACKNGQRKTLSWKLRPLNTDQREDQLFVIIGSDVTHWKQSQLKMEQLAFYDTLTELPNRRLFRDRLQQAVETAGRKHNRVAVMFLDLDRFKRINDSLGHEAGDELLREVAQRLRDCVRGQDTVARLGGDEFTVLLPEIADATTASIVASKISDVLREPIQLASHEVFVTSSIGISIAPDDSSDVYALLRNADLAMYRAKEKGRNNFQYFTEELNQLVSRQMLLETELRVAVEKNQFLMHYQPIYRVDGTSIVGLEALLRWQHPNRGLVFPDEFIGTLEETGLIVDLGGWILTQACLGAKRIQSKNGKLPVSVNLSARQFRQGNLSVLVESVLNHSGLEPGLLHLEITETMLMDDLDKTLETLKALKNLGVGLSIDDFGKGYSSLNYLKRFPVDTLKVDRSFVRNIPDEHRDMEITAAVIAMAHQLKMKVIAEGVETHQQLGFLAAKGCDHVQGYYCGIPTDEDGLDYMLKMNKTPRLTEDDFDG